MKTSDEMETSTTDNAIHQPSMPRRSTRNRKEEVEDDDLGQKWAILSGLSVNERKYMSILKTVMDDEGGTKRLEHKIVDVRKLDPGERQGFIAKNFKAVGDDNERLLTKVRERIDRAGIELPKVEVRFENVKVEAKCHVGDRALPTLLNSVRDAVEYPMELLGMRREMNTAVTILKDVSGIIRPSRMTLLLGPPASGKTTLLRALAGRLDPSLEVSGEVTYNGHRLDEFVPQKTAAYVGQNDAHTAELTVKETLDFSARCQGLGPLYDEFGNILAELERKEKDLGIYPESDVDLFMKALAVEGVDGTLKIDYIIKILELENCVNTIVGDEMQRGISGGEKKRLTTGEMIIGPIRTLFLDEISTGLDSSTTLQIVKCLRQIVHLCDTTLFMSLLQPSPETFELFDDIILLSEGQIVYQGPQEDVLLFFESCGFKCPERTGTADFLQEVTSRKDQEQYWADNNKPYKYISVSEFAELFKRFHVGLRLENELSIPFGKCKNHKAALVFRKHTVPSLELLRASFAKEWLLVKRHAAVYIFQTVQLTLVAVITSTVYLRTNMGSTDEQDGEVYIGALTFGLIMNFFNGFAELAFTMTRLPVLYKHRDLLFYPPWAFTLPCFILRSPIILVCSVVWVGVTYHFIGFSSEPSRFFKQMLLIFLVQQTAAGLFRLIAGVCRLMVISNSGGSLVLIFMIAVGGFILPREEIQKWCIWGYWSSPIQYAYNALAVNEMLAPRWMHKFAADGRRLGVAVLDNFNIFTSRNWYWIGAGALIGFTIIFNIMFTISLMYLNPLGKPQAVMSKGAARKMEDQEEAKRKGPKIRTVGSMKAYLLKSLSMSTEKDDKDSREMVILRSDNQSATPHSSEAINGVASHGRMVLPFTPLSMSFDEVNYYVDMPTGNKEQGATAGRLQLLKGVTGAFRPGILTALMGVSGAGKTTLMDVLAGRKTSGYIEGDIRISGYPKNQATFARVSGYCEQNDIHSPQVTVLESLIYSAFLRLPKEVSEDEKMKFIFQVMELVELDNLKDAIVGLPGVTGLSLEQRKRLTIAVELVANPSIIFMDEPTSGLDARAAAIVIRTVRNTVNTGRTVVCTIHQPSIHIFEAFDELLLMKKGGQVTYFGPLGQRSEKIIEYFEAIPGVPKIKGQYNPATWMIEASSTATELQLGVDFAEHYRSSPLYQHNKALVSDLRNPAPGASDLCFATRYSQSSFEQFKSCLWKQWRIYWRTPDYNLVRLFFTLVTALIFGSILYKVGRKREASATLTIVIGCMSTAELLVGHINCSTVIPIVSTERTVFYRERAAGMYSALPYAIAQVVVEIPYVLLQALYYSLLIYSMMDFQWVARKFLWFFFISFFTFLYFTYYGMMIVSITPNHQVAAILSTAFYALFNLFSGYFIPRPKIPKWWIWYYWICPVAWTVYGIIVSQYGDLEDVIKVPGQPDQPIKLYVKDHFGYDLDFMGLVAAVLFGFALLFALVFAYCIKKLNFQRR